MCRNELTTQAFMSRESPIAMNFETAIQVPSHEGRESAIARVIESHPWDRELRAVCEHGGRVSRVKCERLSTQEFSGWIQVSSTISFIESSCIGCCSEPVDYPTRAKLDIRIDAATGSTIDCIVTEAH